MRESISSNALGTYEDNDNEGDGDGDGRDAYNSETEIERPP